MQTATETALLKSNKSRSPSVPLPGTRVRGSQTGRPVMALLDLLGRRWALRILWELRARPIPTFRELQSSCGNISSSVLAQRLRELSAASIVLRARTGYALTPEGRELLRSLAPVDRWAESWARREQT